MGMQFFIGLGAILSVAIAMAAWVWLGPFAGALMTGCAFYVGAMVSLILEHQGMT